MSAPSRRAAEGPLTALSLSKGDEVPMAFDKLQAERVEARHAFHMRNTPNFASGMARSGWR